MKILNILFFRELVVPSPYPHIIIFFSWKLLLHLLFLFILLYFIDYILIILCNSWSTGYD